MKRFDIEWSYVRRHTLAPAATALCAIVLLFAAMYYQHVQEDRHTRLSADHSVMQQDYDALVYRRRIVDRYHRRYQQFSELGFVGIESRLDWIESLRTTSENLTLPRVSYLINPQLKAIAPVESIIAGDDISIHVSRLELEMGLVHELDLLRFVDELQQQANGLIKVDACDMTWQGEPQEPVAAEPNILANCDVQIFSIITADVRSGEQT
jgi:hypothetical protein